MPVFNRLVAISQERITVAASSTRLTIAEWADPPLPQTAMITVETASIRYLTNGTNPTSTTGTQAYIGDKIELHNPTELENFRAIRTGSTSATLQVIYFG